MRGGHHLVVLVHFLRGTMHQQTGTAALRSALLVSEPAASARFIAVCVCYRSEVGTIFCLSWLITWYGHVLNEPRHTVRLYDFFLACDPLMPLYLAAAVSTCCVNCCSD